MSCMTRLYEETGSPKNHTSLKTGSIDLVAVDQATRANLSKVQSNALITGTSDHGANLNFNQSAIIYEVAIVDNHRVYQGATIPNFSGLKDGDIDVVLVKLPQSTGAGAIAATNAAQVRAAVRSHPTWSLTERRAVLGTIDALSSLRGTTAPEILRFVGIYERTLFERGINPELF